MELLLRIGDSGGSRDGQVIAAKPDGWAIQPLEMKAWIDGGKEPPCLAAMPPYQQRMKRRQIARLRWELTHTAVEIAAEFDIKDKDGGFDLDEAERRVADAVEARAWGISHVTETNWGRDSLQVHCVVRVEDGDIHDYAELIDRDATVDHKATILAKRLYRVAYEEQFDAAKLADIRDPAKYLPIDRGTVVPRTAIRTMVSPAVEETH